MAILSLIFGVSSILIALYWVFLVIPLISIIMAIIAIKRIHYASQEYTGIVFAHLGIILSIILGLFGGWYHYYDQNHSIPSGYKVITFDYLQPNTDQPGEIIPPAAFDLEPSDNNPDKRVFIKEGYIYPGRRSINIKEFILVPTLSHCNYCQQQLKSTDMINVKFTGDLSIDYSSRPIKIGGKMHIDREQAVNPFGGLPYQLEADYVQE